MGAGRAEDGRWRRELAGAHDNVDCLIVCLWIVDCLLWIDCCKHGFEMLRSWKRSVEDGLMEYVKQ